MKTRPRSSLLSVVDRSFVRFGAVFIAVLAFEAGIFAATPADIYQDMESGKDGDLLTPEIMNASSHGGGSTWSLRGSMWVSTKNSRKLPGPVIVDGKTYPGTGGTRTWMFNDSNANNSVACSLAGSYSKITVACYYTPGVTITFWNRFDTIVMAGNQVYAVMQTRGDRNGPYLSAHSRAADGKSTGSPDWVKVVAGKTYWVNLHFDGAAGKTSVAVFDPEKGSAQVGETVVSDSTPNSTIIRRIDFGRCDNHGNNPTATTQSCFDHIVVDYTHGAFPLIPLAADPKRPIAPPTAKDGVKQGIDRIAVEFLGFRGVPCR